jgi:hypothetical protein
MADLEDVSLGTVQSKAGAIMLADHVLGGNAGDEDRGELAPGLSLPPAPVQDARMKSARLAGRAIRLPWHRR